MTGQKTQVNFVCTEEFKDALGKYAQQNNKAVSLVIREAVASVMQYDLAGEHIEDGRRKYKDDEERRLSLNERNRNARKHTALLVAMYEKEKKLRDILALENHLKRKGVSLDD